MGILVYAAFNLWVFQWNKSGNAPSPAKLWQAVTKSDAGFEVLKGDSLPFEAQGKPQGVTFTDSSAPSVAPATPLPTPTPTPRPTGPGQYACSPESDCNVYSDEARTQYCTKTYADTRCLDQCGTKEKQCKK